MLADAETVPARLDLFPYVSFRLLVVSEEDHAFPYYTITPRFLQSYSNLPFLAGSSSPLNPKA